MEIANATTAHRSSSGFQPDADIQSATEHRIVIACNRLFREALCQFVDGPGKMVVDGCATVADTVARFPESGQPDLLICVLEGEEHREAAFAAIARARPRYPNVRWLVLTQTLTPDVVRRAVAVGVDGLLLQDIAGRVLKHATELVLLGQTLLPLLLDEDAGEEREAANRPPVLCTPAGTGLPLPAHNGPALGVHNPAQPPRLSDRERQILDCLVKGLSNKLIARQLDIADATVKVHVKGVLRKLQVANRTQAAILALDIETLRPPTADVIKIPVPVVPRLAIIDGIAS